MTELTGESAARPRSSRAGWVTLVAIILGAIAATIGVILMFVPVDPPFFGWFAYTPLSTTPFYPDPLQTPSGRFILPLFVSAVVLFAFAFGWALGVRPVLRRQPPASMGD
ncbi:MAG: hypothetical protein H7248_05990 [Microbacteriaceae bacterium]|nr:hypothetical protein [Microbacteriaceae bacterium]